MLTIEEITSIDKLAEVRGDWENVLSASKHENLFLTYEWITTWLKHFWKDKPILFLLMREGKDTIGFAPFLVDEEKGSLVLPVNGYSHKQNLIFAGEGQEPLKALFSHLRQTSRGVKLCLQEVEASSFLPRMIQAVAKECRITAVLKEAPGSPFLSITTDWESFLKSKSKHFREEQKRKGNKLKKAGNVEFLKVSNPEQVQTAMRDILLIEKNSWKEKEGTSFTAVPGLSEFYTDLAEMFSQTRRLCAYLLYLNGTPLAHLFGITHMNKYYALKTSYNESQKDLSPGVVLFNYALQDIFQSKLEEFDFLGVESRWKNEIASGNRDLVDIFVYPRNIRYSLVGYYENSFKPLIRHRAPFILTLKRRFLNSLAGRGEKNKPMPT